MLQQVTAEVQPRLAAQVNTERLVLIARYVCMVDITFSHQGFYKKLKNVSCEYYHVNG